MANYTVKDITKDLGFLLSLTFLVEPDEENFWKDAGLEERYRHRLDNNDRGKEIMIFQDPMPKGDFYYFNPFGEGIGRKSPAVQLYYQMIRITLNNNLRTAALYVMDQVIKAKLASKNNESYKLSPVTMRMSSVLIDHKTSLFDMADESLLGEIEKLFDRTDNKCLTIPFREKLGRADVVCDVLTDPQWDEKYSKGVRKKSLNAFRTLIMGVLGISHADELANFSVKYDPDLKTNSKLYTTLSVYLKLYTKFNDILAEAYGNGEGNHRSREINLSELANVIERFTPAYAIAKHMHQPVAVPTPPNNLASVTQAPGKFTIGGPEPAKTGERRFNPPPAVDNFGRPIPPAGVPSPFAGSTPPVNRFKPHDINTTPTDPFSPSLRISPAPNASMVGSNFNTGPAYGNGGYFGNSNFGGSGGINFNAPSNFSDPGVQRRPFG